MSQCSAPPVDPNAGGITEQVGTKTVVGGAPLSDDPQALRDSAIRLAEAGKVRAAIPLFQAAVALRPSDPQAHSDEGVSWMRLQEYPESWGAFKRALDIDPSHGLSLQNKKELIAFLQQTPDGKAIMRNNLARPKPRPPRQREHVVTDIPVLAAVPTDTAWWRSPFILRETRGRKRRERQANASSLEAALKAAFPDGRAEYYPGGMVHAGVKPTFVPLPEALFRLRGPAGNAAKAYLQLNLSPERWERMLELAGVSMPSFISQPGSPVSPGTLPGGACHAAMEAANQSANFELETHWRLLIMGGGAGAGMFLHSDTLRTSSWQMQIRGRKKWHLCSGPGGQQAASHTYCGAGVLDTFDPDYRQCAAFKNAKCQEGVLAPGQVLYYPEDYWHQTISLDEGAAAVSGTVITPSNGAMVASELRAECEGANRIIARGSTQLCAAMATCLESWTLLAGGKVPASSASTQAEPARAPGKVVQQIGRFADGRP